MVLRRRVSHITPQELMGILDRGPDDRHIFLPAKSSTRRVGEVLTALANNQGGMVILGVTRGGTVQPDTDVGEIGERALAASLLSEPPLILPSPQVETLDSGPAVIVHVPPGLPHVYSIQGRYLTWVEGNLRPLAIGELRRLLLERGGSGYESRAMEQATLSDLNSQIVQRYLDRIAAAPDEDPLQVLLARGCVTYRDGRASGPGEQGGEANLVPTVAGILLFGQDPQRFLRSAEVICVRYAGTMMSDEFVRQDIGGALVEQIRQAETFVVSNMRRGMKISGMTRQESTEYPVAVVREAIVNAVAHRDYSVRGEGIRILMFSDRMEIYSPGRLPGHVTLENLQDERYSRNEAIVAVLTDLGYIERLGYGIDRMIATMQEAGLPSPVFSEAAAGFQVSLQSSGAQLVSEAPEEQEWGHLFLNQRQEKALAFLRKNDRITNSDYQQLVPDVSPETIRRDLADLVEQNLLLKIGAKRATYYILK